MLRVVPASVLLASVYAAAALAAGPALEDHRSGIWSLAPVGNATRWVVIHNLAEAAKVGVFHVEILEAHAAAPPWQFRRLANHMAITRAALERSVVHPLQRGAAYPEAFAEALRQWQGQNGGAGGDVCNTSIAECLKP